MGHATRRANRPAEKDCNHDWHTLSRLAARTRVHPRIPNTQSFTRRVTRMWTDYPEEIRYVNGKRRYSIEYELWQQMKQRCLNSRHPSFGHYGGRGITIDPAWMVFKNFLADMGRRPSPELTLERKDNDMGYSKGNCCWATRGEQKWNTNKFIQMHKDDYKNIF